ncbi:MAG: tetratricopeptide repeat protein [Steroidobacteraceae bacterium]
MTGTAGTAVAEQFARAQAQQQQGQFAAARRLYGEILTIEPNHFGALNALGVLAGLSNDLQQAVQYFERAIEAEPGNSGVHCNRGLTLKVLNRHEAALASFDRAIAIDPRNAIAHLGRAETCGDLGRGGDALASYDEAIAASPGFWPAFYGRGVVLQQATRLDEAIASYEQAIRLKPDHFQARVNQALSLMALGRLVEALQSCDQAIALKRDHGPLYLLRGNLLRALDQRAASLASYDQAVLVDPGNAEAHCNRGAALLILNRIEEALSSLDRAIAIRSDYAEAYFHRGYASRLLNRFESAAADYRTVATLAPDFPFLAGSRLEANVHVCEWEEYHTLFAQIAAGAENDAQVSHPLIFMALTDSARLQHKVARTWVKHACPANAALGPIPPRAGPRKLIVGYFSADFHEHPIGRLLPELIEIHDRSRFEIVAFSFGPKTRDAWQQRLIRAFDKFLEVEGRSNLEIASLARHLNVDIAVDLNGFSFNNHADVFALRAAPLQVNYLGYLGTMGASYIDYVIADRIVVTPATEDHFSEKVIYLLDSHQVNDRQRQMADKMFTREELGLPPTGFVFCCFNTSYKISPATFAGWMRILTAAPHSVLLLHAGNETTETNLRAHAARHGVDPQRLVFCGRLPPAEYLARYRAADLFLDTLPYNGGTTASDALWAGTPVLTLTGESFASRIAASLLTALGVPELVTSTQAQYEQLAVELCSSPQRLAQIAAKVRDNRLTSSLFDTPRFARNLESAYTAIHDRYGAGLPPDHIRL